jgi:perosamine synthetase
MISVFEPLITQDDINEVVKALKKGEISGSFGSSLNKFEKKFAAYCGCRYGIAVNSGTSALQLAVRAAGIGPGDEVLVSSSTNIATALAATHNGAIPVPVDSDKNTWNLDLNLVEKLITKKTKAIIPVHLYGLPVDMLKLNKIAKKYNLTVIEDCAESHGAKFKKKMTGSFGDMGCFSFYANKIITTGEGGMIVTNNRRLADRLKLLRNVGFSKPRFKHQVMGYNYRLTGYQAAMGLSQLKRIDKILKEKIRVANNYNELIKNIKGLKIQGETVGATNVYWMYGLIVNSEFGISRDQLQKYLYKKGIDTRTFFCPMSIQPCFQELKNFTKYSCPVAESLWEKGLYLPSSHNLTKKEIIRIVNFIAKANNSIKK